ncbi:type II and III secretion system protein family protein [Desulfolutivibrio sulfoxidireducens]|uniref:type II and III secretion system protein family protein n=1 Tax=Desulfolutivibrio sulfoxidireducens TaxID=2773299 RepID=UPI00159D886A|nr:type II and III secretion system protein family protein [Desulfolutivibrio sulfoxidireducens]QLA17091.1 BON domain-containing protein [Desulfolutivibrio sulfoxidireducens]
MTAATRRHARLRALTAWILSWLVVWSGPAMAGTITAAPSSLKATQRVEVPIGKSVIYTSTRGDIGRVSVANPDIANFVMLSARQVYINGLAAGVTALTVWDRGDKLLDVYDVDVAPDVTRVKRMLHDIMPEETGLQVMASQDSITLSGSVQNSENLKKAVSLAEIHVSKPEKVVNLVKVGGVHQVMLEVRVAEMSRDIANHMGININAVSQGDFIYTLLGGLSSIDSSMMDIINPQNEYFYMQDDDGNTVFPPVTAKTSIFQPRQEQATATVNSATGVFRYNTNYGQANNVTWTGVVDVLKQNGLAKILAEPTLVCLDGQKAYFNAGGQIPYAISSAFNQGIEWKDYGVKLEFHPVVISDNRINLKLDQEVSEIDDSISTSAGPALLSRRASTVVELADGQSFAIAGMLKQISSESMDKFPGLGDIPILGSLFKSSEYQNRESELVIIITVHLAKPLDKSAIRLPTDDYTPPDDLEFFLNISPENVAAKADTRPKTAPASGLDGQFGAALPPMTARDLAY